jgi:hypothetical protein
MDKRESFGDRGFMVCRRDFRGRLRALAKVLFFLPLVPSAACNTLLGNQPGMLAPSDAEAPVESGIDLAPPPWTPASLGGDLVLWLDGDRGLQTMPCAQSTCVMQWSDQSGHGNDAFVPASHSPPLYHRADNLFGGHGAVQFDGATTTLQVADSVSLEVTDDYTIIAVAAGWPNSGQGGLYSKAAYELPYRGPALWGTYVNGDAPQLPPGAIAAQVDMYQYIYSSQSGLDDGSLRVYGSVFDGASLSVRVDDAPPSIGRVSVVAGSLTAAGVSAFVGGYAPSQVFAGDIAELLLVKRTFDDATWARAFAYFSTRDSL